MTVSPHEGVKENEFFIPLIFLLNYLPEIFQIHLMTYPARRRNNIKVLEGTLSPAEKLVALLVTLKFTFGIFPERFRVGIKIDTYRMVNDEIHRQLRVNT